MTRLCCLVLPYRWLPVLEPKPHQPYILALGTLTKYTFRRNQKSTSEASECSAPKRAKKNQRMAPEGGINQELRVPLSDPGSQTKNTGWFLVFVYPITFTSQSPGAHRSARLSSCLGKPWSQSSCLPMRPAGTWFRLYLARGFGFGIPV